LVSLHHSLLPDLLEDLQMSCAGLPPNPHAPTKQDFERISQMEAAESWMVYYFDNGKNHIITGRAMTKNRARRFAAAANKFYAGRQFAQIMRVPPNQ
jgi:hypothetical protein